MGKAVHDCLDYYYKEGRGVIPIRAIRVTKGNYGICGGINRLIGNIHKDDHICNWNLVAGVVSTRCDNYSR